MNRPGELFLIWDDELQEALDEYVITVGTPEAARQLIASEKRIRELRRGKSHRGNKGTFTRKFIALEFVNRLASITDNRSLTNRRAHTVSELVKAGLWKTKGDMQ